MSNATSHATRWPARSPRLILGVMVGLLAIGPVAALGGEPATGFQQLVHSNAWVGWTYGRESTRGWALDGRTLTARAGAAPLLSGYTFGEFELRLRWKVDAGAALEVALPESPRGRALQITLREGAGCGAIYDGAELLAPGGTVGPPRDRMHRATIQRTGGSLTVSVDDAVVSRAEVATQRRFGLGLAVERGAAGAADLELREPQGSPMVRGDSLDGWWTPGNLQAWRAVSGALVLQPGGGNYLRSEKVFGNFVLSLEYQMEGNGNSGIGLRTPRHGWPSGDGMELQLWDEPPQTSLSKHSTMAIYGNLPPLARVDRPRQWNRVVVKADGRMISAWLNGELAQHADTANHPELRHRHLEGWIGFQDHGAKLRVRDLRLREAPPGLGLDAWRPARLENAAARLVDRLMNPEWLARDDGLGGDATTIRLAGEGRAERVLGQWTGPGALVRMARTSDSGTLAFYFDGETQPRIQANPGDLLNKLPALADDANPMLACLAFRKGLKITIRGARVGQYRFDVVRFPAHASVETFTADDAGLPRGWLSAATYRREQFGWGVHRENDPPQRLESPMKTIAAGSVEPLISLDGEGVVHWIKLNADKRLYGNPDLWLEAAVDGQSRPAVSAPLRFWFPGLAGQENYPNYVLVDRGGVTTALPMPFGKGITLAMRNRGARPASGVRLTASVSRTADGTLEGRVDSWRLRGEFVAAGQQGDELLRFQGPGRWIGLVYEEPTATGVGIRSLVVDGKPADGYADTSLGLFFGQESVDFRTALSGRHRGLWWRYLLLEPVDFHASLVLKAADAKLGPRLALFYAP
jgi:hypothetical protein